jgi:hypothetical protein
MEYSLY